MTPAAPLTHLRIVADGHSQTIATGARSISEALVEASITLNPMDELQPPGDTELVGPNFRPDPAAPLEVTVVRVTETLEIIPESIPYSRRVVRSAEMSPDDPPRLLQTGVVGLQEVSVRIVYRDGLEAERWPTAVTIVEPPRDEIILIGVGSSQEAVAISGVLAYVSDGRAIVLEDSSDSPRQLPVEGNLDGRVFQLSPDGRSLLYTLNTGGEGGFRNELRVISLEENAVGRSLQIENVLWAGWDPGAEQPPRIAYTTARSVSLPPGWEANNDLWLLELPADASPTAPAPVRLIETYPTAFAWWGGNYAWDPTGARLAYAFAGEVGVLEIPAAADLQEAIAPAAVAEPARDVLYSFEPFETGADWAWVPPLAWSADGRYLAFAAYEAAESRFDLHVADTTTGSEAILAEGAGIWSDYQVAPAAVPDTRLAYLQASDPADSLESVYALWLSPPDGAGAQRLFPPPGESGFFVRGRQSLAWGPDGDLIAFLFEDALHFLHLASGEVVVVGEDDTHSSHLTWAPYGGATAP